MKVTDDFLTGQHFPNLISLLTNRLKHHLPGNSAHLRMASKIRLQEFKFEYDITTAIPSGVLILLYPYEARINTVFILRQTYNGVHSGQVSFPGGRVEDTDRTIIDTALRESSEEVNIDTNQVTIIGKLTEMYIPPSNYLVTPVLAWASSRPDFKPDPAEVAEIIEADIRFLFDETLRKDKILHVRGTQILAPCYEVNGFTIWGATAMILSELKDIIESID